MKNTAKKIVAGTMGAAGLLLVSAASANADSVHHVVKDDTVWALSQKYGVTIQSIEALNHINSQTNLIYVGQDLQIPDQPAAPQVHTNTNTHTIVVKAGDSLWALAQKYHTTVEHLRELNGLSSNTIYVGQVLKLDGTPTSSKIQVTAKPATKAPTVSQTTKSVTAPKTNVTPSSNVKPQEPAAPVVKKVIAPKITTTVKDPATMSTQTTVKSVATTPVVASQTTKSATPAPKTSSVRSQSTQNVASQATLTTPTKVVSSSTVKTPVAFVQVVSNSKTAPTSSVAPQKTTSKASTATVKSTVTPSISSKINSTTVKNGVAPVVHQASSATEASSSAKPNVASTNSTVATPKVVSYVNSSSQVAAVKNSTTSSTNEVSSTTSTINSSKKASSMSSTTQNTAVKASVASSTMQRSSVKPVITANHTTYTVKSGDSLYTIAQAYGVSVNSIREANPNIGASVSAGQQLIINDPVKNPNTTPAPQPKSTSVSSQATPVQHSTNNNVQSQTAQSSAQNNHAQTNTTNNQQNTQVSHNNTNTQTSQAQNMAKTNNNNQPKPVAHTNGGNGSVVSYAEQFIGTPYQWGGTTPSGFDCSGFVQYVFQHCGVNLPRTTTQQENCGTQIPVSQAQPGDLYFWGPKGSAYHVAIALGGGKYIAAPEPGQTVSIGNIQYFQPSFALRVN